MPPLIRAVNGLGRALKTVGIRTPRLDVDTLLAHARKSTGLSDFGDAAFREPLQIYLQSLEEEAHLTLLGRRIVRDDTVRLLQNRLQMTDERRRHPEIANERIEKPIFILGLPRSGTSILHELMAQDPANRVPMTWEAQHVWPPPETATYATDDRIARVDKHYSGVDRLVPDFKSMHRMAATLPQECVALTAHDFATVLFATTYYIPTYYSWLKQADMHPVYRSHADQLRYFQWRCPADRWVLKSPAHLWTLDTLLDVYPDACIVQTHRDPGRVMSSLVSLSLVLRGMASDRVIAEEIAKEWTERLAAGLDATMSVRASGRLPPERVFDMPFAEFMSDEIGMIQRIYGHFGIELSTEGEARMRAYLTENSQDQHGSHSYSFADTGLDLDTERQRYQAYCQRHDVPLEQV